MNWQSSVIVFAAILGSSFCLDKRYKRVINGVTLNGRPTTYTAIRYYGLLSTAKASFYLRKFLAFFGDHGEGYCSGSLLTPKIFQTACHCVSTFDSNVKDFVKPTFANHEWEDSRTIFFGVSKKYGDESIETYTPVVTEKFILHQKCAKIEGGFYTYDYAIIMIPYNWTKVDDRTPIPWTEIEYAPQQSIKDLREFFMYAMRTQLVCLFVGFGTYIAGQDTLSDELRTGWATLMPSNQCYNITSDLMNYRFPAQLYSWVCSEGFPQLYQTSGTADSGGPITCQNKYFGIVLGHWTRLSFYAPLYYDPFISAIEYREDLIHSVDDLKGSYRYIEETFEKSSTTTRPRPGFVLKVRDKKLMKIQHNLKKQQKPLLLSSHGFNCFATSVTLNIVICIRILF